MVVVSLGLLGHDASSEPQVAPDVQGPQRLLAPERNADGLQGLPFTASRESRESGPRSRRPVSPGRPATGSKEGRWSPELRDCATQSVQRCGSTRETRGGRTVGREAPQRREPGTRRGATQRRRPELPRLPPPATGVEAPVCQALLAGQEGLPPSPPGDTPAASRCRFGSAGHSAFLTPAGETRALRAACPSPA